MSLVLPSFLSRFFYFTFYLTIRPPSPPPFPLQASFICLGNLLLCLGLRPVAPCPSRAAFASELKDALVHYSSPKWGTQGYQDAARVAHGQLPQCESYKGRDGVSSGGGINRCVGGYAGATSHTIYCMFGNVKGFVVFKHTQQSVEHFQQHDIPVVLSAFGDCFPSFLHTANWIARHKKSPRAE